jgi:hypothetical protein
MKNWEIIYQVCDCNRRIRNFDLVDKCFCSKKLSINDFLEELVQRSGSIYVPNLNPYEEIEKKWLLTDFGKENFNNWYNQGKRIPGDSIYMVYSYLSQEPQVRLRKVIIDTVEKSFDNSKKITYFLDIKQSTQDKIKRITTHEIINKIQYDKLFKKSLGTCEKWFIPYYKNMYQLSKVKTKNKPLLYTAEIEFDSLMESKTFIPDKGICLKDVTNDESYSTCNYVLSGT